MKTITNTAMLIITALILACIGACGGSPLAPTERPASITVRALVQQANTPVTAAEVFVDGRFVGVTDSKGERVIPITTGQEVGILVVSKDGIPAPVGTVYGKPGNGEVWTFWFEQVGR